MKFILWVIAIAVGTYWLTREPAREAVKREIAQENVANANASPVRNSVEDDARLTAQASRQKGIPRKVSEDLTLLSVTSIGTQVVATYEFNAPAAIPITSDLIAEMRSEIVQNFRNSTSCTNGAAKAMLQRGVSFVQHYNLHRSNTTILTIQLGSAQC